MTPDSPTDLNRTTWWYVIRRTVREFQEDECTDLGAALTYYAVLSLFPAMVALLSLVGLVGDPKSAVDTMTSTLEQAGGASIAADIEPFLTDLSQAPGAGWGLVLGLAGAIWSSSGYVGAFGRAMNRIFEVSEGRPIWKLRPLMLAVTVLLLLMAAVTLLGLVVSGPVAQAIGDTMGLGDLTVALWSYGKWPAMALIVASMIAVLYYFTPNVRPVAFRWMSPGAALAISIWALGSVAFAVYVSNFSNYDKVYGSLAGAIAALLWLWLTNLALLFGAELNAEVERGRELESGVKAEETIQLPLRDERGVQKSLQKEEEQIAEGREIRTDDHSA